MRSRIVVGAVLFMALCQGWGKGDGDEWERLVLDGAAHENAGNYVAAAASFRDAVRIAEQPGAPELRLPLSLNALARAREELGDFAEAERLYKRAVAILEKIGYTDSLTHAVLLSNLGSLYVEEGQIVKGEALLRQSLAIKARLLPPEDEQIAITCNVLAEALIKEGEHREAEQLLDRARAILEKKPQPTRALAVTRNSFGVIRRNQGRNQEAARLIERAIEILEGETAPDHPILLCALNNLATLYARSRRCDDADKTFQRALLVAQKHAGTNHPMYGAVLANYAAFLRIDRTESGGEDRAGSVERSAARRCASQWRRDDGG